MKSNLYWLYISLREKINIATRYLFGRPLWGFKTNVTITIEESRIIVKPGFSSIMFIEKGE